MICIDEYMYNVLHVINKGALKPQAIQCSEKNIVIFSLESIIKMS